MITVKTFGKHQTHSRPDLDRPDGCDHDQNVYHYRLVAGDMVLRGIVLGHGWEHRPMSWAGLSCYKRKEDDSMAQITQDSGRPEPRADRDEIMAKAKVLIAGGMKVAQAARELGVPGGTLAGWISKEKRQADKARKVLESMDSGKKLQSEATEVVICADCGKEIVGAVFDRGEGPRCFSCAVNNTPSAKIHAVNNTPSAKIHAESHNHHINIAAPIGVEVPDKFFVVIHNTGISKKCAYCGELFPSGTPGTWVKDGFVSRWYCEECGPRTSTAPPSQYMHEDNDHLDDETLPYVVGPDPLDHQIDVMLDALWAEKRAKLKAHLKPLLADTEAWDIVKCIVSRGLA